MITWPIGKSGDSLFAIYQERLHQDKLKLEGRFKYTCADLNGLTLGEKLAILTEELGEVARCISERCGIVNDVHGHELKKELCQVAAIALAWMESL